MFDWFRGKKRDGRTADASGCALIAPSIAAVTFDATGYEPRTMDATEQRCVWITPDGDPLAVYFFNLPPDLPANATMQALSDSYTHRLIGTGAKLVECRVIQAAGVAAVRTLISVPQPPPGHGRDCVGSLTIPFQKFSYVIKAQCTEIGVTGLKAAVLFQRRLSEGAQIIFEDEDTAESDPQAAPAVRRFHLPGFAPDDPKHDAEFPNDPPARARRLLDHVARTLVVADSLKQHAPFPLPTVDS